MGISHSMIHLYTSPGSKLVTIYMICKMNNDYCILKVDNMSINKVRRSQIIGLGKNTCDSIQEVVSYQRMRPIGGYELAKDVNC